MPAKIEDLINALGGRLAASLLAVLLSLSAYVVAGEIARRDKTEADVEARLRQIERDIAGFRTDTATLGRYVQDAEARVTKRLERLEDRLN